MGIDLVSLRDFFHGETREREMQVGMQQFNFGNLWKGDYFSLPESGSFGSEEKSDHFGLILDRRKKKKGSRVVSPMTSKRSGNAYVFPAGVIPGEFKESYLLCGRKFSVLVRLQTLGDEFSYHGQLSEVYLNEISEKLL